MKGTFKKEFVVSFGLKKIQINYMNYVKYHLKIL